MWRLVRLVAIVALVAPMVACTDAGSARWLPAGSAASGGPTTDSDMAAVWSALEETTSKPYRATNRVETVDEAGKTNAWTVEVDADGPAGRFRIADGQGGAYEFLVGNTYLSADLLPGRWIRLDMGRLKTDGFLKRYIDTQTTVWQLIGMVRAVPAPGGFTCEVDLKLAMADPRNKTRVTGLKRQVDFGSDRHIVSLRFDSRGRIAQLSYAEDIPDAAGKHPLHLSEDITYSRFGDPIDLHLPAEADIRDASKADYDLANQVIGG